MTSHEWLVVGGVLAGLALGLPLVRWIVAKTGAPPEVGRKAVHVAMGLGCALFPWCFDRPLPVWILAALATAALLVVRWVPSIRQGVGSALHGIDRLSYGEILFAPAVALVFHLADGHRYFHFIPILILAVADAAGALGGTRWGKRRYGSGEGFKTVEGSVVFLAVAFLCAFLPLLYGLEKPLMPAVCIALILATLAMMGEGLSDRGFDNLVIPLGCFYVLQRIVDLETPSLSLRLGALVLLLGLVLGVSRWSTLSGGALLGAALLGYGCAIIGDWRFPLPLVAAFLCHIVKTRRESLIGVFSHRLDAVLSYAIASLPWVIAFARGNVPFAVAMAGISFAMATELAVGNATTHVLLEQPCRPLACTLKGWLIAAPPGLVWLASDFPALLVPVLVAFAASFALVHLHRALRPRCPWHPTTWWIATGLSSLIASLPALWLFP